MNVFVQVLHLSLLLFHSRQGTMGLSISKPDEIASTWTTEESITESTSTEMDSTEANDQLTVTDTVQTNSTHPETLEQISAMMVDAINSFARAANTASDFLERCAKYFRVLRDRTDKGKNRQTDDRERTYWKRSPQSSCPIWRFNSSF